LSLDDMLVRPVKRFEERRYQALMQAHHYLGALPKIGETLWYVALWHQQWVALLSFSAVHTESRLIDLVVTCGGAA
jgi:hypothetical protein